MGAVYKTTLPRFRSDVRLENFYCTGTVLETTYSTSVRCGVGFIIVDIAAWNYDEHGMVHGWFQEA